ncbi:peptidoglycan recognition protein family protein [Mesorhizobium cantuariense]|uniref:N-acetylmuramoyl-L-alanine amidase n=1 Tax=Mesorhizobium cantuariense TaxID=1300275 RepID=A0ABV7N007_9HYPH
MASTPTKFLNIRQMIIPPGRKNRPGKHLNVAGVTIHNTDNASKGADAHAHAKFVATTGYYMLNGQQHWISWHYTVDDQEIWQSLPSDEIGWHAGPGNSKTIGIEICMNVGIDQTAANERAAALAAGLLHDYNLGVDSLYTHHKWTGKRCPVLLLNGSEEGSKWLEFKNLVEEELADLAGRELVILRKKPRYLPQEYSREDETIEIGDDWEIPEIFLTKSDMVSSAVMYDDLYMNSDVIDAVHEVYADFGHRGYNLHSNFTNNFNFDKHLVKASNPPYTMCVSSQFEIILKAIIMYCDRTRDPKAYSYLSDREMFGLNGMTLQNCVWENEGCHSVGKALSLFGMGEIVDFSQLSPGSFISYDHPHGGHSVCFIGYLDAKANIVQGYGKDVVGFRFFSSNGSGSSGDGLSYRNGVLTGRQMDQGAFKQATGIHNMRCGMMYSPENWKREKLEYYLFSQQRIFAGVAPTPPSGQP